MRIDRRGVLATGAGSGLGEDAARHVHRLGSFVVLADLPASSGERVARDLGARARFVPADITKEQDVRSALDAFDASRAPEIDAWLRETISVRAEAFAADPGRAMTPDQVREALFGKA